MSRPSATEKMKRDCLIAAAARQGSPITCAICGQPIMPGQRYAFDHGHSVGRGGPNTVDNLFPVHDEKPGHPLDCHNRKTAHPRGPHTAIGGDTFEAAKTDRLGEKHTINKLPLGTPRPKEARRPWGTRKIQSGRKLPTRGSRPMNKKRRA